MPVRVSLLVSLILILTLTPALAQDADLLGYWSFDDGTAADQSGKGNHGLINGSPLPVPGVSGNAFQFHGVQDYIDLQKPLLNNLGGFTIAFYMKPARWGNRISMVGQNDAVELIMSSHSFQLWTQQGGFKNSLTYRAVLDGWVHFALSVGGGKAAVYVNGVEVAASSPPLIADWGQSNFTTKIAAGVVDAEGGYFAGCMDEVRIYRRGLTANEVAGLLVAPADPVKARIQSSAGGAAYIDGIYTGKRVPATIDLPGPGVFQIGVGGNDGVFRQRSVAFGGGTTDVALTGDDAVPARPWKVLLLAIRKMFLENGQVAYLTDQDIQEAETAFRDAAQKWVKQYTYSLADWQIETLREENVAGYLVRDAQTGEYQDNINADRFLQDAGLTHLGNEYDTVFYFWPRVPEGAANWVCCTAWGGGFGVSVPNSWPRAFGWTDPVKEVWLHEWLHIAEGKFMSQGYYTGSGEPHGHEEHGYQKTQDSWLHWYKDFMRGQVAEEGQYVGLPPAAWSRSARVTLKSEWVRNGASFEAGAVAPGEIVTLFGALLGPDRIVVASPSGGAYPRSLAGIQVLFDGMPSTVLYGRADQVSAIAPFSLAGKQETRIQVGYGGILSDEVMLPVQEAAPGIFSANSSGAGQAAVLNQDYTVNGAGNPADIGSVIMVYATGGGLTLPPTADSVVVTGAPSLALPVSASIGGKTATVTYSGAAPGLVAGVVQVNIIVPSGIPPGEVSLILTIGEYTSQQNITVAVK